MKSLSFLTILLFALFAAACGTETTDNGTASTAESACPAKDSETHLSAAHTSPDKFCIMLHHTDRECTGTGANTLRVYVVNDVICQNEMHGDTMAMMAAAYEEMNFEDSNEFEILAGMKMQRSQITSATITQVDADMPAHGHGLTKAPTIDADDPATFDINFQMGGDWVMDLALDLTTVTDPTNATDTTTITSQTISFELDVKD